MNEETTETNECPEGCDIHKECYGFVFDYDEDTEGGFDDVSAFT